MVISREDLEHIAKVARIALTEDEINELLPQFNEILELLARARELPLVDEELLSTTDAEDEFREDAAIPFSDPDAIVAQFPKKRGRYAEVPPNL
ncbi:MAG: aspartyl/glutamyl-tRNA amidotransferase subunit C [Candidatus Diapherotrites archaeon]|nr:aspartyl/glutamyl-tRNA amidotransferase subunit C [Candidatus Diapherotrites archaeon]